MDTCVAAACDQGQHAKRVLAGAHLLLEVSQFGALLMLALQLGDHRGQRIAVSRHCVLAEDWAVGEAVDVLRCRPVEGVKVRLGGGEVGAVEARVDLRDEATEQFLVVWPALHGRQGPAHKVLT